MPGPATYDKTDPRSILEHARKLLDKSLRQVFGDDLEQQYSGKGGFGQLVELVHFGLTPNNRPEPDFPEAGVELKTTPLKSIGKGYVSKERLVLGIIDFMEIVHETFETGSLWKKNSRLLLMFYLYHKGQLDIDNVFRIIDLWDFPERDKKIIKDDWLKIKAKVCRGKAEELSEGDTFYLGACPKGADKTTMRRQPHSPQMAMQRAYSLKSKYLNEIIGIKLHQVRPAREMEKPAVAIPVPRTEPLVPIVPDQSVYREGETFEDHVIGKFQPYYGITEAEISRKLGLAQTDAKGRFYLLAKAILGVPTGDIEEFVKADVIMKTIRLEASGALKESMSFPQIQYTEIIEEEWLESCLYETLTKRFFFIVFQKDDRDRVHLVKVFFWTMPNRDLGIAESVWQDTKQKIKKGDFENFVKISDDRICHVRPHGADSSDVMETAIGTFEMKKCFWLNASYIKKIVEESG